LDDICRWIYCHIYNCDKPRDDENEQKNVAPMSVAPKESKKEGPALAQPAPAQEQPKE